MGFSINNLLTDEGKKTEGVWIQYAPGLRFLVASTASAKYRGATKKAAADMRGLVTGQLTEADIRPKICAYFAQHVLLGWEGLTEADETTPIEYTTERARELLLESEELYNWVSAQAANADNFRPDLEEAEKN